MEIGFSPNLVPSSSTHLRSSPITQSKLFKCHHTPQVEVMILATAALQNATWGESQRRFVEYCSHSPALPLRPLPQVHSIYIFSHPNSHPPPTNSSPCKKYGECLLKHQNHVDVILPFGCSQSLASSCMSLSILGSH